MTAKHQRRYIEANVYEEAKCRIRHIYEAFDSVCVCFSGGKDSLVALHVTWEVAQELGHDHINVVFLDEEVINQSVIDFVNEYRVKPWIRMRYFCYPLKSQICCLSITREYVQWDPRRQHIRPIPEHAIQRSPGDDRFYSQHEMSDILAGELLGRVALITGIRAQESPMRMQACMAKMNENYITKTGNGLSEPSKRAMNAKPLFDWLEPDIFRYLYEHQIRYCEVYDA